MSKKQSLLIPLQELKRRIPACSLSDLYGSVIQGHTRNSSPAPGGERCHVPSPLVGSAQLGRHQSAAPSPGSALPRRQDGKEKEFWEAERGGSSLLPKSLIYAVIYFHICHLRAELHLSSEEQWSCFGWGRDEHRVAVE